MLICYPQAARKLAITEVDLERAEARLEAADAWVFLLLIDGTYTLKYNTS